MVFGVPPQTEAALYKLEMLLYGYQSALDAHHVKDDMTHFVDKFGAYLRDRYGWSMSCGPFSALIENSVTAEAAWDRFWMELEAFAAHTTAS